MSYIRTVTLLVLFCLPFLSYPATDYAQEASAGIVEYNGLEFSLAKAEMVDWDPANSYILVILRIKNNSNKTVRYAAKNGRELLLVDDLGKSYYGMYAHDLPETGIQIFSGEQQKIGYAFQKPDLNCSLFTMIFSKNDLQGLEQVTSRSQDDGYIRIPIPVKKIIVWPKSKDRHETDFKKELNINGLIFIVNEAFIWRRPVTNDSASSSLPPASPGFLGVTFDLINTLMTNRVDMNENFTFSLADDLGNKYMAIKPPGYPRKLKVTPERFPRIYPGESYRETVFFDSPADETKSMVFSINATSVGIKKEISVKIPAEEIERQK